MAAFALTTAHAQLEEEIATLRTVLSTKARQASELKRRLGVTAVTEMTADFYHGLQSIKESGT